MKQLAHWALDTAAKRGATYCDARIVNDRHRALATKNGKIGHAADSESLGIGIRVLVNNAWGFASTDELTRESMSVDGGLPLSHLKTIAQFAEQYTGGQRYLASLFAVLAGLAVLLAAIGVYATISQSITRRQHELGVRMALGAPVRQTLAQLAMPGLRLAALGIGVGLVLARFVMHFLEHLLCGVGPGDPLTFLAMAALLLVVTAGSSVAAGARILRMDPAETLRSD